MMTVEWTLMDSRQVVSLLESTLILESTCHLVISRTVENPMGQNTAWNFRRVYFHRVYRKTLV